MNPDIMAALKDKKFQLAAGGAVVVGGVVFFLKKKNGGPAAPGDVAATSGGSTGTTVAGGSYDSTGSDVADWMGQYSQSLQGQLDGFAGNLGDQLDKLNDTLGKLKDGKPVTTQPVGTHPPTTTPPGKPVTTQPVGTHPKPTPKPSKPVTVKVGAFTSHNPAWNSTLSGIAEHEHTSVTSLMKLNPWIKNKNMIQKGKRVRVK